MSETTLSIEQKISGSFDQWINKHYSQNSDLKSRKQEAIKSFEKIGMPGRKSELYKYTPISKIFEKNVDLSFTDVPSSWTKESCKEKFYQVEEANHLVFLNGSFNENFSSIKSSSNDLEIRTLDTQGYAEHSEIRKSIGLIGDQSQDPFASLNLAFFNQGLFLKASKNSENLPTFIYHFIDSSESELVMFPRIFVIGEQSSSLQIYEKTFLQGENKSFACSILESEVASNATVNYTKIQNYNKNSYVIDGIYAHQGRDSKFLTNTFSFNGAVIRNNIYVGIDDENCEAHMHGLYLISGKSHVDNNTSVDHRKPNSYSNELYKGVLSENSRAVFNGKIYVRPDAQKTNAFQANNNILLSDSAIINTKPQLEIWADDVQCSHGCTTGQLDEEAIFYLRSRGIEKNKAKALMLNAFASETLVEVKEEVVKEEVQELILNRLN